MSNKAICTDNSFKKTTAMIAVIQLFSTISLAILYSTLVLYATQKLKMSVPAATAVMGAFAAFNYGLHILGGFFGGRLLSWRLLFIVGMVLLTTGCILLSIPTLLHFHLGVAFFLAGAGLNVTCINMMVTQLFEPDDKRRESVFFWNYALMNVGFFIGYS